MHVNGKETGRCGVEGGGFFPMLGNRKSISAHKTQNSLERERGEGAGAGAGRGALGTLTFHSFIHSSF